MHPTKKVGSNNPRHVVPVPLGGCNACFRDLGFSVKIKKLKIIVKPKFV